MAHAEWQRTVWCGEVSEEMAGQPVTINGWVQRVRDHGSLLFVDVRDRTGIVQVTFDAARTPEAFRTAREFRSEYVVSVSGTVRLRAPDAVNPKMKTGTVEIEPSRALILSEAKTPPFYIEEGVDADELLRLRYRYLDLRRPDMQRNLALRHRFVKAVRDWFDAHGFYEIETPMLTRSTPEGARDFLVPSRLQPGSFYALPQSPQLFKQLLMVSGLERYVQIVRCFRDEDLRADRQPEFTQIDVEMSFVTAEDVMTQIEAMLAAAFRAVGKDVTTPFPRMDFATAMARYGSDKPDLRFGLPIVDVTDIAAESEFGVFRETAAKGGVVRGIAVPPGATLSRKDIDGLAEEAKSRGAKGLAWLAFDADGLRGPVAKHVGGVAAALQARLEAEPGSVALFVADEEAVAAEALGHLRLVLGRRLNLVAGAGDAFLWVTDFPMFEWNADERRWEARHHPFTSPVEADLPLLETDPARVRAQAYDLVWNGVEIGGGSIRIHRRDVQERVFRCLGFSKEEAQAKFGFLLDAFEYGVPPHGGIAFGLDRLIMMLAGADSLRDVIAFPKTARGADPLTGAPAPVDPRQLEELAIRSVAGEESGRASARASGGSGAAGTA
ncbi:MAG: aspartate--tRNA ligase [Clostridia bacterium]|nr:aspartate--tRNA ligase [Clostridia bacterium]